ncbi:MAG: TOBE domain-containing protein [Proteobacteria bacterium]|nr:TOBE domain-containing protein [Pseudomonadota bacterium]
MHSAAHRVGSGARGAPALVCIRPEELQVLSSPSDGALPAHIVSTIFHRPTLRLFVEISGGQKLMIDASRGKTEAPPDKGALVYLRPIRGGGRIFCAK